MSDEVTRLAGPRCTCPPPAGVSRNHLNACPLFDVRSAYRQGWDDAGVRVQPEPQAGDLDVAWSEVESVLPEGWRIERFDLGVWGSWWAWAGRGSDRVHGEGDTPVAALRDLRAALQPTPEAATDR